MASTVSTRSGLRRHGLTLMELVVVMAILAALAAILVPLFPNLYRRAHKTTDATQTNEVAKAVQLYQGAYVSYPDDFDLLTDGTAAPAYLPTDGGAFGGFATAQVLTAGELSALRKVGVKNVQKLASVTTGTGFHPTMNPYAGTVISDRVDLSGAAAATTNFMVLDKTAIATANPAFFQAEFANDPTARYVVFGVGARCTMIGKTIQDAPTSVPQKSSFTPDNTYSRVGVVFKVSGAEVAKTERARFIAAVALEDDELETTEKDIIGYYEVAATP